ncbi:MAG: hypothetical protein Q4F40_09040 [Akkermansia sp.]|nr:hypothetical protein [Akkermansia sp.]
MNYSQEFCTAEITETRKLFEELLRRVSACSDLAEKERMAREAIILANKGSTGYYSSEIIEDVFTAIAQQHSIPLSSEYKADSFLHVMTMGYEVGGHTRVVERWIENSPSHQQHDVVFIAPSRESVVSKMTQITAEKRGRVHVLKQIGCDIDKALELRTLASRYEYVILHVHMDDVVPLVAFGTTEFKRPIIFFNHADHRFWLGCSISDAVAEIREWGINISRTKRGITVPMLSLGIPVTTQAYSQVDSRSEIRKVIGIPETARVVTTVGGWHKYKPLFHLDFLKIAQALMEKDENLHVVAIGPTYQLLPNWNKLRKKFPERFHVLDPMSPEQMFKYLSCSDLSLDSFPMSGGTALIDAVTAGCPVLSLDCPTGQLDYVMQSGIYCKDQETLIRRCFEILDDPVKAEENKTTVKEAMLRCNSKEAWKCKLPELYCLATSHSLHSFTSTPSPENEYSILDYYLFSECYHVNKKFRIPGLFTLYSVYYADKKQYLVRFFH